MEADVIIIGAGASGLMCALTAGKRKRSVLVLEHKERVAGKIAISGGGQCNFTNLHTSSDNYVSSNPHFTKSALARFTPIDFRQMLDRHRISYKEKEQGQLFCTGSAEGIIRMLGEECSAAGVRVHTGCRIGALKKEGRFIVTTNLGTVASRSLVVATGGLSYPALGATDIGHRIAYDFGLRVTSLRPALVGLTLGPKDLSAFADLAGVSLVATVSCGKDRFTGTVLFTHRGLSGPAILQASLYWAQGAPITIDLLPDTDALKFLLQGRQSKMTIENYLSRRLPSRFTKRWSQRYLQSKPMHRHTEREFRAIAENLRNWQIVPVGTEGYGKAEVTLGGVDTDELSSQSMGAKKVPGLYFSGEVIDVTGQLGGYNLQWAWSSGYAAGEHA